MKIQEIYTHYQIMPSLQQHMLRVASVAYIVCESFQEKVDKDNIITACLLHDMGNILKFNMDLFPDFFQPEGKEFWQKVKKEYENKYGSDEHIATMKIVEELQLGNRILELVDSFQFSLADKNAKVEDYGRKICVYADMRVEPRGIVSMEHRFEEGRKRFYLNKPGMFDKEFFNKMTASLEQIEEELFTHMEIEPSDISDESAKNYIESLRNFELR
jgi:5'-deoxynucleotidase YfbR-like HD superfamily hydrolase